jgi:hypothetical protein
MSSADATATSSASRPQCPHTGSPYGAISGVRRATGSIGFVAGRVSSTGSQTLRLIHLPIHASWRNQVEIYFSVVQRKVVAPNYFHTLTEVESRLLDFQQHYEEIATPFEWRFTKNDTTHSLPESPATHHH